MSGYVAIINMPGCLPESEPVEFDSVAEAWAHLAAQAERWEDLAYVPDNDNDPEGPASLHPAILKMQEHVRTSANLSVLTSVYFGGYAFSVDHAE